MKNRKRYLKYKARLRKLNRYGTWVGAECEICKNNLFFYDRYDAVCCVFCDIWIEEACGDPDCPYCAMRPSSPYEAMYFGKGYEEFKKDWLRQNYQHKDNGRIRHMRKAGTLADIRNHREDVK